MFCYFYCTCYRGPISYPFRACKFKCSFTPENSKLYWQSQLKQWSPLMVSTGSQTSLKYNYYQVNFFIFWGLVADFDITHFSLKWEKYSQAIEKLWLKIIDTKVCITSLIQGLICSKCETRFHSRELPGHTLTYKPEPKKRTQRQSSEPIKTHSKFMYIVVDVKGGKTCVGVWLVDKVFFFFTNYWVL